MIHTQYAHLEMPSISSKEQLTELLQIFAEQVVEKQDAEANSPFAYLQDYIEGLSKEEDTKTILSELMNYVDIEGFSAQGALVIVQAHYEGDADNYDLCDEISKFLFDQTMQPYFLMRSATADRDGAYAHQRVGYRKDGAVVLESTKTFFDQLFTSSSETQDLAFV